MKIELKNIHRSEKLSEETSAFSANLYINDIKAGIASNRGQGGATMYISFNEKGRQLIQQAEAWCSAQPQEKFTYKGKEYSNPVTLENFIDNLLAVHLQRKNLEKFKRKLGKDTQKGIAFGIPDQEYQILHFKMPIKGILEAPNGYEVLRNTIVKRVVPQMKEGEKILNTNIPEKILKDVGLGEHDYVRPGEESREITPKKGHGKKL
ncbi:hypothetical protein [Dinghuibacter silviterrae]|uniref:Uncharacterized protein n=1 Tax=Dinghuibacter silviterrae TaxID=1539049 RepID=A0A4R8DR67_9BACT|nr:hypothetical protein [Dinghuibacter silviterrae]TDX00459.1 hypothetical protein EDB95_1484 [Dinghuibacter silviterrae]